MVVPADALLVLLDIERAGHRIWEDGTDVLVEPRGGPVDPDMLARLRRWKPHVRMLLNYTPTDDTRPQVRRVPNR